MRLAPATPLAEILEDEWDAQLFRGPKALAVQLGWRTYHVLRSKGSRAGYPDRTCVRERVFFAELKREKTKPTPDQVEWLDGLAKAGAEVYVIRPSDLEEFARVLSHRGRPDWVPSFAWRPELWTPADCWIWPRAKTGSGYGNHEGRVVHRITYETFRGPIPDGFDLHHVCRNRACANPWHLTALPHDEHAERFSRIALEFLSAQPSQR